MDKRIFDKYLNRRKCENCESCIRFQSRLALDKDICNDCEDGSNHSVTGVRAGISPEWCQLIKEKQLLILNTTQ